MWLRFLLNVFLPSGFVFVMMGVPRVGRGIGQRSTGRSEEECPGKKGGEAKGGGRVAEAGAN